MFVIMFVMKKLQRASDDRQSERDVSVRPSNSVTTFLKHTSHAVILLFLFTLLLVSLLPPLLGEISELFTKIEFLLRLPACGSLKQINKFMRANTFIP